MRRKYIVDKKFQWTIIGYSLVISLLTSLMHLTLARMNSVHSVPTYIAIIVFTGFYAGIFLLALFFSNRLAGPLFRLRRHLLEAVGGKPLQKLYFRSRDFFSDLNEAYNSYVDSRSDAKPDKRGFALPELLVVVAILGLLATMAITTVSDRQRDVYVFKSEVGTLKEALQTARNAAVTKSQCAFVTRINARTLSINTFAIPSPCTQAPLPAPDFQQVVRFKTATTIGAFSSGTTLVFRPTGGLTSAVPVTVTISLNNNQNLFTIYPAIGQVRQM